MKRPRIRLLFFFFYFHLLLLLQLQHHHRPLALGFQIGAPPSTRQLAATATATVYGYQNNNNKDDGDGDGDGDDDDEKTCTAIFRRMASSLSLATTSDETTSALPSRNNSSPWDVYVDIISGIMDRDRVVKNCKKPLALAVQNFLLDPTTFAFNDSNDNDNDAVIQEILNAQTIQQECKDIATARAKFRAQSEQRRQATLVKQLNFSKSQNEYMDRCFVYVGDRCAALQNSLPLQVAWLKWRWTGGLARENSLSTYMYVLLQYIMDDNKNNSNSNSRYQKLQQACLWDVLTVHDLLYAPNEKTITLRIQSLIAQKNPLAAEALLQSLDCDDGDTPTAEVSRLRTYIPILAYYCQPGEDGDMSSALRLFHQMRETKSVHIDAATYALLLSSMASQGYFHPNSLSSNQTLSTSSRSRFHTVGPKLLDELTELMAQDLLELTESAAQVIYEGFVTGFQYNSTRSPPVQGLDHQSIPPCSTFARGQLVVGRVAVDPTTAICSGTNAKLRLLALNDQQRQHVHDTLLDMAYSLQEDYRVTFKSKTLGDEPPTGEYCRLQLLEFSSWLQERTNSSHHQRPYTAFVDGANVAHFGSGYVQYSQVKLMVEELERMGERPLVIMPRKYASSKFFLRLMMATQELNQRDKQVINTLVEAGKMFIIPTSCFDDYYWMIASVTNLNSPFHSPNENETTTPKGRVPGLRPFLITNDQMRDHRLALLKPRPFRRWTSCHIVNYKIGGYDQDPWETTRNVTLFPPKGFSREIQCNPMPGESGRNVWHFPVTNWHDSSRLCISLAPPKE